jgi:hypothetical protein
VTERTGEEELEQLLEQLGKAGEVHGDVVVDDVRRILARMLELEARMLELDAIILDELLGEP